MWYQWWYIQARRSVGQGTGFVYDLDGHIITNYHVIENANAIETLFPKEHALVERSLERIQIRICGY